MTEKKQLSAAFVTTFPDYSWEIYAKKFLQNFIAHMPAQIPLLVALDDANLYDDVLKIVRDQDAVATGWEKDHAEFVARNKDKDHETDYRKMAVRFCHKVFAIKRAADAIKKQRELNEGVPPRYLIWIDADVMVTRPVALDEIEKCLPKEGDAVSYLGRKDWDHSECGWLAFDLENDGDDAIEQMVYLYRTDTLYEFPQWHDSWLWDHIRGEHQNIPLTTTKWTNLTADKPGMDIWPHSPMAAWSRHYKGPSGKQELAGIVPQQNNVRNMGGIRIITKNSLPNETLQENIKANQAQIRNWVRPCKKHDEEIVICSAGPMLIAEDLRDEAAKGRKIIAVKHALTPLKEAGVKPWGCILLDPREHVGNFVDNPDTDIIWFVASQVQPSVVKRLLDAGCTVWGYHAAVGADEHHITKEQEYAVVSGGSATATRGIYLLDMLGFRKFRLYGYDLCCPDKPNLEERDERGQPKYLEFTISVSYPNGATQKRAFWSEPQYIAQYEEMTQMINKQDWSFEAHGPGIAPYIIRNKNVSDLRAREKKLKLAGRTLPDYAALLGYRGDNWLSQMIKRLYKACHKAINPIH